MLTQDFCYYLQGFAELTSKPPSVEQWAIIKSKLESVFQKVTPDRSKLGVLADLEYIRVAPGINGKPPERLIEIIPSISPVAYCAGAGENPLSSLGSLPPFSSDAFGNLYKLVTGDGYVKVCSAGESPSTNGTKCGPINGFGFDPTQPTRSC